MPGSVGLFVGDVKRFSGLGRGALGPSTASEPRPGVAHRRGAVFRSSYLAACSMFGSP